MSESALIFDTHEDIQELVKSGMPEPQAETVVRQRVRLLERNLATKADIAATNADIETLRLETKADIAATNANIETLRLETKADIAATNANIETLRLETKGRYRGNQRQYRDAAAGDRKADSSRQERYYQVGCRRQSRGRRLDRGRNQTPLIAGLDRAQSASSVAPAGSMSAPMLAATLAVPGTFSGAKDDLMRVLCGK